MNIFFKYLIIIATTLPNLKILSGQESQPIVHYEKCEIKIIVNQNYKQYHFNVFSADSFAYYSKTDLGNTVDVKTKPYKISDSQKIDVLKLVLAIIQQPFEQITSENKTDIFAVAILCKNKKLNLTLDNFDILKSKDRNVMALVEILDKIVLDFKTK